MFYKFCLDDIEQNLFQTFFRDKMAEIVLLSKLYLSMWLDFGFYEMTFFPDELSFVSSQTNHSHRLCPTNDHNRHCLCLSFKFVRTQTFRRGEYKLERGVMFVGTQTLTHKHWHIGMHKKTSKTHLGGFKYFKNF